MTKKPKILHFITTTQLYLNQLEVSSYWPCRHVLIIGAFCDFQYSKNLDTLKSHRFLLIYPFSWFVRIYSLSFSLSFPLIGIKTVCIQNCLQDNKVRDIIYETIT